MDAAQSKAFKEWVNNHKQEAIDHLRRWVQVKSVSCQADTRPQVIEMIHLAKKEFEELNCKMFLVDNPAGMQMSPDGVEVPYPPVLMGQYPEVFDDKKKTILLYGHLDVQPAAMSDGWDFDPWDLTEDDGKLYGRGSTDDKAPVLGWYYSLKAFQELKIECPVNLKFCFEGMEESGSVGLDEVIFKTHPDWYSKGIDGTCISDNYWLGTTKPCLTYGLRGIGYWHLSIQCASRDLHSGVFGGTIHEAMTDLFHIMASLVDQRGQIQIPGIMDDVDELTDAEKATYDSIDFCKKEFSETNGTNLIRDSKEKTLQRRWRWPSLSLHGVEGAFAEPGEKTVIPRRVIGKFSIRMVPSMDPQKIHTLVDDYIKKKVAELKTPNKVWLTAKGLGKPWYANPEGFLFEAGKRATKDIYGVDPDLTREGGSIPVTISFQDATQKPVILLPMGSADDGAHSQNEKINIRNYIEGIKLLGTFLQEIK